MSSVKHLQHKREELQQQYELLCKKIKRLRNNSVIEAGTSVAFQLDHEIKRFEAQRDRLVKQIDSLEIERVHNALLQLNYFQQAQLFRKFIAAKQRIGSFLVHGSSTEHGQIWLLKRLLRTIPETNVTTPLIEFYLDRRIFNTDVGALWKELANEIGVAKDSSHEKIAEQVVNQLKNQHLILVIHEVDYMGEAYLEELIRDFWLRLVDWAQPPTSLNSEFFLLMFLVDYTGNVSTWNTGFALELDSLWKPSTPIKLPIIDCLSEYVLASWIENVIDSLPLDLTTEVKCTVQAILENSENGIPELVFKEIFQQCGCNWQQERISV